MWFTLSSLLHSDKLLAKFRIKMNPVLFLEQLFPDRFHMQHVRDTCVKTLIHESALQIPNNVLDKITPGLNK